MENRLALYDAETGRSFYKSLFDDTFINLRIREQELKNCILRELVPVWRFRKINSYEDERDKRSCYSVTLKKDPGKSFIQRVRSVYKELHADRETGC